MKGNALIDTNIWVYAITQNDLEKHQIAQKLIRELKPDRRILSSPQIYKKIAVCPNQHTTFTSKPPG